VQERLKLLTAELDKLPKPAPDLTKDQVEDAAKRLKVIHDNLVLCDTKLGDIEKTYGFSTEERKALAWFIEQQQAELRRLTEAAEAQTQQLKNNPPATPKANTAPSSTDKAAPPTIPPANGAPAPAAVPKTPPSEPAQPKK
jgi:CRISPR/Cas system CMR-associated protein Cmr1 (group 7 of RAMP superfamily)